MQYKESLTHNSYMQETNIVNIIYIFFSAPGCIETKVRLVDGETPYDGRVEICVNDHWVSICMENWNDRHAAVVCRQLGHNASKFKHL